MRLSAFGAGLLLSFVIFSVQADTASAQNVSVATLEQKNQSADMLAVLDMVEDKAVPPPSTTPVEPPQPTKHVVVDGETLSAIAAKYQTTWLRIYAKNMQVENPDVVNAGIELVIPLTDEQLAERPLPVVVEEVPAPVAATAPKKVAAKPQTAATVSRGSVAGNTYTPGNCTWYAKNRRPDLPNNLGNAYTWVSRAAAQGIPTSSTPRVGAVGQAGNHVVYVESVNGDGTVTISEMNRTALYVISTRTVPASYFQYIL